MIARPTGTRVWIAPGVTDVRKGIDGLAELVQVVLSKLNGLLCIRWGDTASTRLGFLGGLSNRSTSQALRTRPRPQRKRSR